MVGSSNTFLIISECFLSFITILCSDLKFFKVFLPTLFFFFLFWVGEKNKVFRKSSVSYRKLKMSIAVDRSLMALSLDEEEEALLTMLDLPEFSSTEENALSLMGRALNPECQRMSGLIITMPRKWQKEGRVRGVALFREKFQFIFKSEHDLEDVLEKDI